MTKNYIDDFYSKQQCAEPYQTNRICLSYFYKKFNEYPTVHNIKDVQYLEDISQFHDPILTHVALYLYNNYEIAKEYFHENSDKYNNSACAVLNRWLDQKKKFYTNFGRCYFNLRWWNSYIEPLWERLNGKVSNNKKCKRSDPYYNKKVTVRDPSSPYNNDRCYEQQPEDYVCFKVNNTSEDNNKIDNNYIEDNCAKLSILFYLGEKYKLLENNACEGTTTNNTYCKRTDNIYYNSLLKSEHLCFCDSFISAIAFPTVVTVLGTIFFAFFLSEFTPIGSIMETRFKNEDRLVKKFNEEVEYEAYRNINKNTSREKNIIYYQSMD